MNVIVRFRSPDPLERGLRGDTAHDRRDGTPAKGHRIRRGSGEERFGQGAGDLYIGS